MRDKTEVEFPSQGDICRAWLFRPADTDHPPVVVMAHGLGAIREMRLEAYAERFCAEGYAALVFDYRHFGASDGQPRQLLDIRRQLEDWAAALDFVRGRSDLDGQRLVLWGTSFSGGHVLATAANDQNITAVISQCPFTNGFASALAMDIRTSLTVGGLGFLDRIGSRLGRPPILVNTAGPPGSAALMTAPDAEPGYLALVPAGTGFVNLVAARAALDIPRYFPGRRTPRISCPVLFCVCEQDSVAPAKATLRHAGKTPQKEIKTYPEGHFDIYVGEAFQRVIADQIDFLKRHLPAVEVPGSS